MSGTWDYTWDIATPPESESPTYGYIRIQESKAGAQERLNVDHYFPLIGTEVSDADAGEHKKITIRTLTPAEVAELNSEKAYIYRLSTDGELYFQDGAGNTIQLTADGILNIDAVLLTGNQEIDGLKVFLKNVDFNKNQALNLVIENCTSDPDSPATGQIWFRTDL